MTAKLTTLAAIPLLAVSAAAQDKADPIPTEVDGLLQAMSAQLKTAKTFAVHANILVDEIVGDEQTVQRSARLDVVVQRPSSVHAVFSSDTEKRKLWMDGKTATLYDADGNLYATTKVPGKIGPAFDHLMDKYGLSLPLSDFFFANPYEALTGSVQTATYVGTSEVEGVACHHLAFTQETIDWQLWIEEGGQPAPRKLLIVYKNSPGMPRYQAILKGVDLRAPLSEQTFKPILPDDATAIDFLEVRPESIPE